MSDRAVGAAEALQREITRIALDVLADTSFVLAGSGAIREHGLTNRPTEDVDLFTADLGIDRFSAGLDALVAALRTSGYVVTEVRRVEQYARLEVTDPNGLLVSVDLGVDWREEEPVTLEIGRVLSLLDAVGNKVSALHSRAYPRDFLDVDAIRASGRYSDAELIASALDRDPGFEVDMFATQLDLAARIRADAVAEYGVSPEQFAAIQARFALWAEQLRGD